MILNKNIQPGTILIGPKAGNELLKDEEPITTSSQDETKP